MSDEDVFGSDFGSFEDFMKGLKPGEHRPLSGILRYRQGNHLTDWTVAGDRKYVPGAWQMLAGCAKWSGSAASSGMKEFNFAAKFLDCPLVFATPDFTWPLLKDIRCLAVSLNDRQARIYWWAAEDLTQCSFSWLAIGPVGP